MGNQCRSYCVSSQNEPHEMLTFGDEGSFVDNNRLSNMIEGSPVRLNPQEITPYATIWGDEMHDYILDG